MDTMTRRRRRWAVGLAMALLWPGGAMSTSAISASAVGQTLPASGGEKGAEAAPARDKFRSQFRAEVEALLRSGVERPYGLGFSASPEVGKGRTVGGGGGGGGGGPTLTFESGGTPGAGLMLLLGGELLDDPRLTEAAGRVGRLILAATDGTGRVPGTAQALPGQLSQREPHGNIPKRGATHASLGFLLTAARQARSAEPGDREGAGPDRSSLHRLGPGAVRCAGWLLRQQLRTGAFPVSVEVPGQKYPVRAARLDVPDVRDGMLALALIQRAGRLGSEEGAATGLPALQARAGMERAGTTLLRQRLSDPLKPSKNLWPSACDTDTTPLTGVPALPPTGNLLATRYAMQALLAYHLEAQAQDALDVLKLAGEAVNKLKGGDGTWTLVDDPANQYPAPPDADGNAAAWPRSDFGLPQTLQTVVDLRTLGGPTYLKLVSKTLPIEVAYAAMLTGLTDDYPTADLPLSASQVEAYVGAHPEIFGAIKGLPPVDLGPRLRRLWALYLLAGFEKRFDGAPAAGGAATAP